MPLVASIAMFPLLLQNAVGEMLLGDRSAAFLLLSPSMRTLRQAKLMI